MYNVPPTSAIDFWVYMHPFNLISATCTMHASYRQAMKIFVIRRRNFCCGDDFNSIRFHKRANNALYKGAKVNTVRYYSCTSSILYQVIQWSGICKPNAKVRSNSLSHHACSLILLYWKICYHLAIHTNRPIS